MSEMPNWIFLIFFALVFTIFYVWNKHNKNYLTVEEKKLASSLLSKAWQRELKYIWVILLAVLGIFGVLFILERVFQFKDASELMYVFFWFSIVYGVFRNRAIYQKAYLPTKFIKGDSALGIFMALAFAAVFISILLD